MLMMMMDIEDTMSPSSHIGIKMFGKRISKFLPNDDINMRYYLQQLKAV